MKPDSKTTVKFAGRLERLDPNWYRIVYKVGEHEFNVILSRSGFRARLGEQLIRLGDLIESHGT